MDIACIASLISFYKSTYDIEVSLGIHQGLHIYEVNSDVALPSASLIKLFVLGAVIKAVKNGKLDYQSIRFISENEFVGGSGIVKYTKQSQELSIRELIFLMLAYSDNIATNALLSAVSIPYVQDFISELGAHNTKIVVPMMPSVKHANTGQNTTSIKDVLLCQKVLVGKIPSSILSEASTTRQLLLNSSGSKRRRIAFAFSVLNFKLVRSVLANNRKALSAYLGASMIDQYRRRLTKNLPTRLVLSQKSATGVSVFHDSCILSTTPETFIAAMIVSAKANYTMTNTELYVASRRLYADMGKFLLLKPNPKD